MFSVACSQNGSGPSYSIWNGTKRSLTSRVHAETRSVSGSASADQVISPVPSRVPLETPDMGRSIATSVR